MTLSESQESHDETTQRAVLSDFQTTFLLEAGAGTGKTQLLLQRLLALLRTGRSPLDRIAVITFTDKAATELRTRLRAEIESALQSPLAEAERDALQAALRQLNRAFVMTVHAFCAALLRERAFEARLDAHFVVLDQAQASVLQDEVWHAWLATELNQDSQDSQLLRQAFRAGLTISHLASLRDFLSEHRDCLVWLPAPVSSPIPTFCHSVQDAIARLAALRGCCQDTTDKVWEQITLLIDAVPTSYEEEAWERFLIHGLTLQPRKGKKANWQPASALQEARVLLIQIKESYLQARSAWFHNLTLGLARWMEGYLQAYQAKKQQRCSLDFLDLLVILRDVLKQNHELRRYFQRKFDFLLVDEVQDTDPLQAEIAFFLAEDQPQAEHWTQVSLRPGKLFLVGDPQQSIYRFRRADLDVYRVVRSIIEQQGSVLPLSTNFRMRAGLVDWMNETFAHILRDLQDLHDDGADPPSYQPLLAANSEQADGQDPTVFLLQYPQHQPNGQYKRETQQSAEAQCVARFVRHIVEQKPLLTQTGQALRYGDIALLFRTNRSLEIYEGVLREGRIPYRSVRTQQKTPSMEGEELRACLRSLEHPADTTAFVATLRSSLFGFSDEELAQFICAGGKFDYLCGVVPARLPGADRFHAAFALLRTLHSQQCSVGIAPLVSEIYARTPSLPLLSLHQDGQQRQRALLQLVEAMSKLSRQASQDGDSVADLEHFLAYASRGHETGEDTTSQDRQDALHLLTIHKAKGLEFSMVILAEPESQQNRLSRTGLVERKNPRLDLQIGPRSLSCTTQGWQAAEAQERRRETAEERRLWYVAATRAREYVGIPVQAWEGTANKKGKRDILGEEVQRSSNTVIVDLSDQDTAVAPAASVSADELSVDERERPFSVFLSILGADKPAPPEVDALYSDLAWLTERRRLLAKGRRKGQTQKKKMIRTKIPPWQPTNVDRVVKQIVARVRENGSSGVEEDGRSIQERTHADLLWQRIAAAPVWARVRAARRCIANEGFALRSGKTVLEGMIPLAWLEDEKWIVLYFHEGEMLNAGTGQTHICERLGPSAWALEQLTPFPVSELIFFFINQQQEIRIAWNTDTRASLQDGLQDRPFRV